VTKNERGRRIIDVTVRIHQAIAPRLMDEVDFRVDLLVEYQASIKEPRAPSVIGFKRAFDCLAFLASWREGSYDLPTNPADVPNMINVEGGAATH